MSDIKRQNTYLKKREGVITRGLYFSIGFMISMGLMISSYPQGRTGLQARFYDLKQKHTAKPLGKHSSFIRVPIYISI